MHDATRMYVFDCAEELVGPLFDEGERERGGGGFLEVGVEIDF